MKHLLAIAAAILCRAASGAVEIGPELLDALAAVESGGNDSALNVRENAHGRYQIRPCYLADANAAAGTSYTLAEMHDPDKAAAVVRAYLTRYGAAYERRTGRAPTDEELARIHNGGPRGAERAATIDYARRVREAIKESDQ